MRFQDRHDAGRRRRQPLPSKHSPTLHNQFACPFWRLAAKPGLARPVAYSNPFDRYRASALSLSRRMTRAMRSKSFTASCKIPNSRQSLLSMG